MPRRAFTEIFVCGLIGVAALVFLIQALRLPPGTFEPLGSGPVPAWTAAVIIVSCTVVIVRAVRSLARTPDRVGALKAELDFGNLGGGGLLVGLTVVYVAILQTALVGFGVLTTAYLTLMILGLERFRAGAILPALLIAAVAAFGAQYVFTEVFFVDLPV